MLNFLFKVRVSITNSIKTCHPVTYHIALFTNASEIQATITAAAAAAAVDILTSRSETRGYQKYALFHFILCIVLYISGIRSDYH